MVQVIKDIELPKAWRGFRLPPALQNRLSDLLDRLDREGRLSTRERREAKALTELVDVLSLMKARASLKTNARSK